MEGATGVTATWDAHQATRRHKRSPLAGIGEVVRVQWAFPHGWEDSNLQPCETPCRMAASQLMSRSSNVALFYRALFAPAMHASRGLSIQIFAWLCFGQRNPEQEGSGSRRCTQD